MILAKLWCWCGSHQLRQYKTKHSQEKWCQKYRFLFIFLFIFFNENFSVDEFVGRQRWRNQCGRETNANPKTKVSDKILFFCEIYWKNFYFYRRAVDDKIEKAWVEHLKFVISLSFAKKLFDFYFFKIMQNDSNYFLFCVKLLICFSKERKSRETFSSASCHFWF